LGLLWFWRYVHTPHIFSWFCWKQSLSRRVLMFLQTVILGSIRTWDILCMFSLLSSTLGLMQAWFLFNWNSSLSSFIEFSDQKLHVFIFSLIFWNLHRRRWNKGGRHLNKNERNWKKGEGYWNKGERNSDQNEQNSKQSESKTNQVEKNSTQGLPNSSDGCLSFYIQFHFY
jgi:hypothetical protein